MNETLQRPLILYPSAAAVIANAVYQSYESLEAFMFERSLEAAASDMGMVLTGSMAFFLALYAAELGRSKNYRSLKPTPFGDSLLVLLAQAISLAFAAGLLWLIYIQTFGDPDLQATALAPLILEIASLAFVTGSSRKHMVHRQLTLFLFWTVSVLAGFCALGVCEEYGLMPRGDDERTVALCAVLFHLTNACYLFYRIMIAKWQMRLRSIEMAS